MLYTELVLQCLCAVILLLTSCASDKTESKIILRKGELTCNEKKSALDTFNILRRNIAEKNQVLNMNELGWDDGLAWRAQMWTEEDEFAYDPVRTYDSMPFGQNVVADYSSVFVNNEPDFPKAINAFLGGESNYTYGYFRMPDLFYLQVVWSKSYVVGCGFISYVANNYYVKKYVCNVAPGGDYIHELPYVRYYFGCSNKRKSQNYINLCAPPNNFYKVKNRFLISDFQNC